MFMNFQKLINNYASESYRLNIISIEGKSEGKRADEFKIQIERTIIRFINKMLQQGPENISRLENKENFNPVSLFLSYVEKTSIQDLSPEQKIVFYAFILSKQIYHIVQKAPQQLGKNDSPPSLSEVTDLVFTNTKIKETIPIVQKEIQSQNNVGQVGDRKTSFFRTIIRSIKKHKKTSLKKMESEEDAVVLDEFQKKLSANTISGIDVKKLEEKFGEEIRLYLNSYEAERDMIVINKSKINKVYYMLHLREISIASEKGKLSQYSFYGNKELEKQLKEMIRCFYDHIYIQKSKHQSEPYSQIYESMDDISNQHLPFESLKNIQPPFCNLNEDSQSLMNYLLSSNDP